MIYVQINLLKIPGFKDYKSALKTINLISKSSLKYQFDVMDAMFNRIKYHLRKTE
jgi:hypothetical protein